MRISDWSSDVCSSDLVAAGGLAAEALGQAVDIEQRHVDHSAASPSLYGAAMRPRWPAAWRSPQSSVSEQTHIRPPLSSRITSSRKLSAEAQSPQASGHRSSRSEQRRVGKEIVRNCCSRWSPYYT